MDRINCLLLTILSVILISYSVCHAANCDAPAELKRLLSSGEKLYGFKKADLNGDGLLDHLFIVTQPKTNNDADCAEGDNRVLKIALRSHNKKLHIVKSNENIILCKEYGGVFGDPYTGMEAGKKWFRVSLGGGSSTHWYKTFEFRYSRKDKSWHLVLAQEGQQSPNQVPEVHFYKPPKDYDKIDIENFDPDNYRVSQP